LAIGAAKKGFSKEKTWSMKFERQKMVKWFSVPELAVSGIKVLVSTVFGNYADKREAEATPNSDGYYDYSEKDEIWLDYISDTGDGFDSTFTMASLIAKDNLTIDYSGNADPVSIPRGKVLIMGGDQVYPTPGNKQYWNHLQVPFNAAFPWKDNDDERPNLFAIPGNHDWYDGLGSFLKLFCQDRSLGNWLTRQKRSYFALKLPYNTWIWGIDIQLHADIDLPQLQYFEKIATEKMARGDRVILCTAEPAWVYEATTNNYISYDRFDFFVNRFFSKNGIDMVAVLTGDLHHYARYEEDVSPGNARQYFTSGGGGAFTHPTHGLPENIKGRRNMKLKSCFPEKENSRKLLFKNWWFPFHNFSLPFLLGIMHLFVLWLLQSNAYVLSSFRSSFLEIAARADFPGYLHILFLNLAHNPAVVLLNLTIFGGILSFTDTGAGKYKQYYIAGVLHGISHLVLLYLLIRVFSIFNLEVLKLIINSLWVSLLYIIEMLFIGSIIVGFLFGFYLILCNLILGSQGGEAFSALRYTGFKNFLRIRITSRDITFYPVGVRKVVTNWKNIGTEEEPGFTGDEIKYRLIEQPIVIKYLKSI
jgi:hypothetical protein